MGPRKRCLPNEARRGRPGLPKLPCFPGTLVSGPCTRISNLARAYGDLDGLDGRTPSAAASPQSELKRTRLTRQTRHGLPSDSATRNGTTVGALTAQALGPSIPLPIPDPSLESGGLDPRAKSCMVMDSAVPQCWAPRLDGRPVQNVTRS